MVINIIIHQNSVSTRESLLWKTIFLICFLDHDFLYLSYRFLFFITKYIITAERRRATSNPTVTHVLELLLLFFET